MLPITYFARNTGFEPRIGDKDKIDTGRCVHCGRDGDVILPTGATSKATCPECRTLRQCYPSVRLMTGQFAIITEDGCDFWSKLALTEYSNRIKTVCDPKGAQNSFVRRMILSPPTQTSMAVVFEKSNDPTKLALNSSNDTITISGYHYRGREFVNCNRRVVCDLLQSYPTMTGKQWDALIAANHDIFTSDENAAKVLASFKKMFPTVLDERLPSKDTVEHYALCIAAA